MTTDVFEILQVVASAAGIPMVVLYRRSAKKNIQALVEACESRTTTAWKLAHKEVHVANTLLWIQVILLVVGVWAVMLERPPWVPPVGRMTISLVVFAVSYVLWSRIIPLHTKGNGDVRRTHLP